MEFGQRLADRRIERDGLEHVLGVMGAEDLPETLDLVRLLGNRVGEEMFRALADVREDRLLRQLGEAEVAARVVHRRGEVRARIDEGSVQVEEDCVHPVVPYRFLKSIVADWSPPTVAVRRTGRPEPSVRRTMTTARPL